MNFITTLITKYLLVSVTFQNARRMKTSKTYVINTTVYNRIFINIILIDVYKYNLIDACINVFLESLERKFMLAILIHGKFGVTLLFICS